MSRRPGDLIVKDPSSTEPLGFDWTSWLTELGESVTIASSSWTISGPDSALTQANDTIVSGSKKTQVYLGAGTPGARYTVTNRITTNSSPAVTDDRSFVVRVQNR